MKPTEFLREFTDAPSDGTDATMAKNTLHTIVRVASHLEGALSDNEHLPEWVEEKLGAIKEMMVTVMDYALSQHEIDKEHEDELPAFNIGDAERTMSEMVADEGIEESDLYLPKSHVEEGQGDFEKALARFDGEGNIGGWIPETESNYEFGKYQPMVDKALEQGAKIYDYDDNEGGYDYHGEIIASPDGMFYSNINNEIAAHKGMGEMMRAIRKAFDVDSYHGMGEPGPTKFDKLNSRRPTTPDDLYKVDNEKLGRKKGTLTKSRRDAMKSPYRGGLGGPKGVLPEQGVAEGVNEYLWHGSRYRNEVLVPRQANDTGGKEESNKNDIYATPSAKVAIAMGLTTPGSDTGMFPNDPQMVLFKGGIRKGEMVYLHKVPKDLFIKHNSREWYSKPDVKEIKPIDVVTVPVDKWLSLIRTATPKDLELQKKNMKKQGVAEGRRDAYQRDYDRSVAGMDAGPLGYEEEWDEGPREPTYTVYVSDGTTWHREGGVYDHEMAAQRYIHQQVFTKNPQARVGILGPGDAKPVVVPPIKGHTYKESVKGAMGLKEMASLRQQLKHELNRLSEDSGATVSSSVATVVTELGAGGMTRKQVESKLKGYTNRQSNVKHDIKPPKAKK